MHVQEQDTDIIKRVLKGSQAAYSILVTRYQPYVFTLVLRYVHEREVAEELAQDIFVKAYRYLPDFRGNSKFSTWLYTIVHTTCISHTRKKATPVVYPGDDVMPHHDRAYDDVKNPFEQLEQKDLRLLVEAAIRRLPDADAEVIALFYLGEQSVEEISLITGITPSNVKVRLFRARQKLKEILETRFSIAEGKM